MGFENNEINGELSEEIGQRTHWVVVAEAPDRTTAEFAVNGLKSYDIPAVLDTKPGVLGSAGLKLRSFYTGKIETFKIMVPGEHETEALELVKMFIDSKPDKSEGDEG
ncbi:MAG: hypothetical protein V3V99_02735 [candidate division Zixibacteria bacterium]